MLDFLHNTNIQLYILAYLLGGIPFGLLLAKKFAGVDIKNEGSKSIGATNVLRVVKQTDPVLAKKLGIATVVLDALKGALPIIVAILLGIGSDTLWAMAVLAVFGHCFSPYLMFEGGKGVATGMGVCVVLAPLQSLVAVAVWFISAKTIKISSLSSLLGLCALVAAMYMPLYKPFDVNTAMPVIIIAVVIIYQHRGNIARLLRGEEARAV